MCSYSTVDSSLWMDRDAEVALLRRLVRGYQCFGPVSAWRIGHFAGRLVAILSGEIRSLHAEDRLLLLTVFRRAERLWMLQPPMVRFSWKRREQIGRLEVLAEHKEIRDSDRVERILAGLLKRSGCLVPSQLVWLGDVAAAYRIDLDLSKRDKSNVPAVLRRENLPMRPPPMSIGPRAWQRA